MHLIPILLAIDAVVGGTVRFGAEPVTSGTVTFFNSSVSVSAPVGAMGAYSLNVPDGTYDVRLVRNIAGRRRTTVYNGLILGSGNHTVDLAWPSDGNAETRSALVRTHFDAGRAAFVAGRYQDAATHYTDALREDSSQDAIWSALALSQAMAGDFDAAERSFASAVLWGAGAATASNMANAYYRAGHFNKAGAKYEIAAAMQPTGASTYFANAGAAYFAGRMNKEAEAAYRKSANAPNAPAASWYFYGVTAQSNGNRDDALAALRAYLQADSGGRYAADARQRIAAMGG
jgi:tetratricopeptide (TPR) repeat protein